MKTFDIVTAEKAFRPGEIFIFSKSRYIHGLQDINTIDITMNRRCRSIAFFIWEWKFFLRYWSKTSRNLFVTGIYSQIPGQTDSVSKGKLGEISFVSFLLDCCQLLFGVCWLVGFFWFYMLQLTWKIKWSFSPERQSSIWCPNPNFLIKSQKPLL